MLVAPNSIVAQTKTDRCFCCGSYSIFWRGFVYLDGFPAGEPSIKRFAEEITAGNLYSIAACLKGIYCIAVQHLESGECYVFVDGSGLCQAFYSDRFAGTSFLELAKAEGLRSADFDPESLVEFLHTGNVYSGRTLFQNIRKIDPGHILRISRSGFIEVDTKPVPDISLPPKHSFEESMRRFVESAAEQHISVDLTGGIDSRLLAVILQSLGLSFEVATCGVKDDPDVRIAQQVADALGMQLQITERAMNDVDWAEAFNNCDGLFDVVRSCSQLQMRKQRLKRGVDLVVSGVGGELLKDFWWLQDMPLYSRSHANLEKLFAYRIAPAPLQHSYLSERFRPFSLGYPQRTLGQLSNYIERGNTWTYDRIYYSYKMREYAGRSISNNLHEIACYAPYLEPEVVAFGYNLPRTTRFFNNFHRQTITALNVTAARIPTTEGGMSVSAERLVIGQDLFRYVSDKLMRLANKLGQRIFNRSYLEGNFAASDTTISVRELTRQRRTLDRLKDSDVLNPNLETDQVSPDYLGRMLSLDMLIERLETAQTTPNSNTVAIEAA